MESLAKLIRHFGYKELLIRILEHLETEQIREILETIAEEWDLDLESPKDEPEFEEEPEEEEDWP